MFEQLYEVCFRSFTGVLDTFSRLRLHTYYVMILDISIRK